MPQFNENDLTAAVVKSFENAPDKRAKFLLQELVKSLHEKVRVSGRGYDCWVQEWKSLDEQGEFAGRTTVWGCENTPAGWVRQLAETRDPDKGGFTRSQQQLVDFKFN